MLSQLYHDYLVKSRKVCSYLGKVATYQICL
ncbi:hypothetical protein Alsa3_CDS0150 [Staphylococcus phage Alsa_3]|nr:hypothetical protein Alsa3_CDS0150 [Staphylococcus phage Alsa_3]WNM51275.1 hypothetical protein Alsa4_CDS0145 [Staphylococcus phage Alsa_4]